MNSTSKFSPEEIKTAENALMILAQISADFWQNAIISTDFVLNGQALDYERGYKDRVQKILPTGNTRPVSMTEALDFRNVYLSLAKEKIKTLLEDDDFISAVLGKPLTSYNKAYGYIDFGGWDNDATGLVSKALTSVGIKGYMHYGSRYRKRSICLFYNDGAIRNGFHKYDALIYSIR